MTADGIKHADLEKCIGCGRGMMHRGDVTFVRLTLERFVVDAGAVERAAAMETMMGVRPGGAPEQNAWAAKIANVMGPNEDLAKRIEQVTVLVCQECAIHPQALPLLVLFEKATERASRHGKAA